ncbi:hypothetical protein HK149_13100 [Streptococcus agalactiae]|nr:hypothetical protein [Streptococcus agalactiae]
MANIYARETALKNVVGRSDYISNPKRQEEIVLHKQEMKHDWKEYADFEKANQKSKPLKVTVEQIRQTNREIAEKNKGKNRQSHDMER